MRRPSRLGIAAFLLASCRSDSGGAADRAATASREAGRPAVDHGSAAQSAGAEAARRPRPLATVEALAAVPLEETLQAGAQVRARLGGNDHRLPARETFRYARAWALEGAAGRSVTVELASDDPEAVDPYLLVSGPGFAAPLADDDGGGGCDARMTLAFPADGTYRVVATTWGERQEGEVTLRVRDRPAPSRDQACNDVPATDDEDVVDVPLRGRVEVGGALEGALTTADRADHTGRRQQGFALPGLAGESVIVALAAEAFRPRLVIIGPGLGSALHNEAAPVARIALAFPKTGIYRVVVTSESGPAAGPFTLRVELAATSAPAGTEGKGEGEGTEEPGIIPGERVGPVTRGISEENLERLVGPLAMARDEIPLGEGETEPGTILFHEDPVRRLEILWVDPRSRRAPREIMLRGQASRWRTREGVTLGTSLAELETLNGGPFTLAGMGWDYEGRVGSWNGGRLTATLPLEAFRLRLGGGNSSQLTQKEQAEVGGDEGRSSSLPAMRKLNPRVYEIRVILRR